MCGMCGYVDGADVWEKCRNVECRRGHGYVEVGEVLMCGRFGAVRFGKHRGVTVMEVWKV